MAKRLRQRKAASVSHSALTVDVAGSAIGYLAGRTVYLKEALACGPLVMRRLSAASVSAVASSSKNLMFRHVTRSVSG